MAKNINTIRSAEADMLPFELQKILCDKKMPLQCQGFNFILSNSDLHIYSFFKNPELSKFCICHILVLAWHYWTIEPSSTFFAGIGLLQRIPLASITCHSYLKYWQSFVLPCLHSWVVQSMITGFSGFTFFQLIGPGHEAGQTREYLIEGTTGLLQDTALTVYSDE